MAKPDRPVPPSENPKGTLTLIRPGGLGDSLMLAPALSVLRQTDPRRVHLVGYPDRLSPLFEAGLADRVDHLDTWMRGPSRNLEWHPQDRTLSFLNFTHKETGRIAAEVFPPLPSDASTHVARYLAQCLGVELPTLTVSPLGPLLATPTEQQSPSCWIHPGSGGTKKRWPLGSFLSLAREIGQSRRLQIRFLIGEAEMEFQDPIERSGAMVEIRDKVLDVARSFHPGDWFIGNDSGVGHLAALCGIHTLVVFGPTSDPVKWRPCGKSVVVVTGKSPRSWPDLDTVLESMQQFMGREAVSTPL